MYTKDCFLSNQTITVCNWTQDKNERVLNQHIVIDIPAMDSTEKSETRQVHCFTGNTLTTRHVDDCKMTNALVIHVFLWRRGGSIFKYSCTLGLNNETFLTDLVELIHYTFTCMLNDAFHVIPTFSLGIKKHLCKKFTQIACILLFIKLFEEKTQVAKHTCYHLFFSKV